MIITMKKDAPKSALSEIIENLHNMKLDTTVNRGTDYTVIGVIGDTSVIDDASLRANENIENITRVAAPFKKANRLFHPEDSIIDVGGIKIGGNEPIVFIAGPCSIEGEDPFLEVSGMVKESGACMLRGGAYKPRTSPYTFQGLGKEGIDIMVKAREKYKMPIVSELMSETKIEEFDGVVDMIQIGARNMQNFELLKALGKIKTPILLKRGLANTIEEWIMSAEYIMAGGNENVILCERGIRTFEKYTRNTLDVTVIPIIKKRTHLPIVIDPSHATGDRTLVEALSLAAVAAGADGLIIEAHQNPPKAWSDGAQNVTPEMLKDIITKSTAIAKVIGRDVYSFN